MRVERRRRRGPLHAVLAVLLVGGGAFFLGYLATRLLASVL